MVATFLGSGQVEVLAQRVEQSRSRVEFSGLFVAVDA
jgi:hypothetical protein